MSEKKTTIDLKELNDKFDLEEITNMQYIELHGEDVMKSYRKWCELNGCEEGDEEMTKDFANSLRYGDEPDGVGMTDDVWDLLTRSSKEEDKADESNMNEEDKLSAMELVDRWRKEEGKLKGLRTSENAIKVTLWRYLNPHGSKQGCNKALDISRNTVKKWWNVSKFIDGTIADGGHVHPIRFEHDIIKKTILSAVEKAEKKE